MTNKWKLPKYAEISKKNLEAMQLQSRTVSDCASVVETLDHDGVEQENRRSTGVNRSHQSSICVDINQQENDAE